MEHPRLHVELGDEKSIAFERGLPMAGMDEFKLREFDRLHMYFGGVQAALWNPAEGLSAVADSRRSGNFAFGGA